MPSIILKKTFKNTGFQVANEKSYSFHGGITQDMINQINALLRCIRVTSQANTLQFKLDAYGHFYAAMNHNAQKHHEEDFVVAILDKMEEMGYTFKFQYDTQAHSSTVGGQSETNRELFIFHKSSK